MEHLTASDVMNRDVIHVTPDTRLSDVARLLIDNNVTAVVVVENAKIVGVVSEGDLLRRPENETDIDPAWWVTLLSDSAALARRYVKTHGQRAGDIMTSPALTVTTDTPLAEVATIFETRRIKQVPVTIDGRLIGLVSRRDIVRSLAERTATRSPSYDDSTIRAILEERLAGADWAHKMLLHTSVHHGVVDLEGWVNSASERRAVQIAAETIPGVRVVEDHLRDLTIAGRAD